MRTRGFDPDGAITTQIAVDRESIELTEAESSLRNAIDQKNDHEKTIAEGFYAEREAKILRKAKINRSLSEFKVLEFSSIRNAEKPETPVRTFEELLIDLDRVKSVPLNPEFPSELEWDTEQLPSVDDIYDVLVVSTSPSTVADTIKRKIDTNPEFYREGTILFENGSKNDVCPFCEQNIVSEYSKNLLDSFVKYFSDEEEKHRSSIRALVSKIHYLQGSLAKFKIFMDSERRKFDHLKGFLPSRQHIELDNCDIYVEDLSAELKSLETSLNEKSLDLALSVKFDSSSLSKAAEQFAKINLSNSILIASLNEAIKLSDSERKQVHRKICNVFRNEFIIEHWSDLETLRYLEREEAEKSQYLLQLQRQMPSTDAKTRVAETFERLLDFIFSGKYKFDRENFILTHAGNSLPRKADKTLSDGEKTSIAFCYFIASIHKKVSADVDYKKLFIVFDDPVASMSFDYIFSIAQILKNLSLSDSGEISINPNLIGPANPRPRMLILTHSTYFFNILATNRVVKDNAAFSMSQSGDVHLITNLKTFVAPFQEQLRHIKAVKEGTPPDFGTANCVRSVLEAVGRFCHPDKSESLTNFITFLAGEENIQIKSVIINALSHGSFTDEIPPSEDLILACEEALLVVERFAPGQLKLL